MTDSPPGSSHDDAAYTRRLLETDVWWKRAIGAQRPYRNNIRTVAEGRVLDVGCGVGRNLLHLDGEGVGVDTNPHSVELARSRGLIAYPTDEFDASPDGAPESYGTLLFAHVLEHMTNTEAKSLVGEYLRYLRAGGRVVVIVPQEAGFSSDPTHVAMVGERVIGEIAIAYGLEVERIYSFPLPRFAGRVFKYNETVGLLRSTPGLTTDHP